MSCVELVLGVMLSLPTWHQDRRESTAERAALIRPVAVAICRVAPGEERRQHQAYLIAQAYSETTLARYVLEDRCHDGPKGARCDEGLARGPWQVHRGSCPPAWDPKATRLDRYVAGARCALRIYRAGLRRCGTLEGAFFSNSGRIGCRAPWARKRVVRMARVRSKLERAD